MRTYIYWFVYIHPIAALLLQWQRSGVVTHGPKYLLSGALQKNVAVPYSRALFWLLNTKYTFYHLFAYNLSTCSHFKCVSFKQNTAVYFINSNLNFIDCQVQLNWNIHHLFLLCCDFCLSHFFYVPFPPHFKLLVD